MRKVLSFAILFIVALIVRLVLFQGYLKHNPCKLMYDAGHYHELAQSVVQSKGFTQENGAWQFHRVPGYSLFLSLAYVLFGTVDGALILQIVISSILPVLIALFLLVLFPGCWDIALIAGGVACIHPGLLIFSGLVMTETLFVFFFLLFLLLFFRSVNDGEHSFWDLAGAGLFLGCASLIRPVPLPLCFTSLLIMFLLRKSLKQYFLHSIILLGSWFVVVAPWLLRNFLLTGYLFFHTLPGVHFLNHTASRLVMSAEKISYTAAQKKMSNMLNKRLVAAGVKQTDVHYQIKRCNIAQRLAVEIACKYPVLLFFHACGNMFKTMFSLYSSELLVIDAKGVLPNYSDSRNLISASKKFLYPSVSLPWIRYFIWYEIILHLFIILGFLLFIFLALWKNDYVILYKIVPFVVLFVLLSFACGFARLRLPIESFFIIVSSMFWIKSLRRKGLQGG